MSEKEFTVVRIQVKRAAIAAACAVLGASAPLRAVEPANEEPGYLQTQMRERGWGGSTMETYGLRLGGYIQAGYTYNFNYPGDGSNGYGFQFNEKQQDPTLNQISISLDRAVPFSADRFDTGFEVQVIYGSDARFTQANGTNFYGSGYAGQRNISFLPFADGTPSPYFNATSSFPGQSDPENQIDILQGNMTFNLPVAGGMQATLGKFVTPWGVETIDPTKTPFYSHSYIFALSTPKTLTGLTVDYRINPEWQVMGGVVVGWDQSLEDNNNCPSGVIQVTNFYTEEVTFALSGIFGPEAPDSWDQRFLVDFTAKYQADDRLWFAAEAVLGWESDAGSKYERVDPGLRKFQTLDDSDALWYGVAGYATYQMDDRGAWVGSMRGEWFNDGDGGRLLATEVWALTASLAWRPFVDSQAGRTLVVRPEFRWDYSDQNIFDDYSRNAQITFSIDVTYAF